MLKINFIKKIISLPKKIYRFFYYIRRGCDSLIIINENMIHIKELLSYITNNTAISSNEKYRDQRCLAFYLSQVYSQNNEDGIIAEIFRRIGNKTFRFVEIGVENGLQNNTRFLLQNNWKGVWIEANESNVEEIKNYFYREIKESSLEVIKNHVTRENINSLFKKINIPNEFDFLSIDIDMNTHHIWDELNGYKPMVACIEYNASIPPSIDFSIPYDSDAKWDHTNFFGAGLKTLEFIGRKKGYTLVGCDCNGVNAFFVRDDLVADKFLSPFTAEFHYQQPRYASMLHHFGHLPFRPTIKKY